MNTQPAVTPEKVAAELLSKPETIVVVMAKKSVPGPCSGNCLPEKVTKIWPDICKELQSHPLGRDHRSDGTNVIYGVCVDFEESIQDVGSTLIRLVRELRDLYPANNFVRIVFHGVGRIIAIASDCPEAIRLAMSREFTFA